MDHHKRVQTSEAFINSAFLAVSGGFQDAYTYFTRDGVFSNAQTGNVVLMSERFMNGEVKAGLHYLIPLTAFFLGVLLAERIQDKFRYAKRLHWRQGILLVEIILLFLVGFIPGNMNVFATTLVSFSCALQVQTFRKVEGNAYASTMHRKPSKRHRSPFRLHEGKEAKTASSGIVLLRHHSSVCHRRRSWRQTFHSLRPKSHLGFQHPAPHQLPSYVYRGNGRGRASLAVSFLTDFAGIKYRNNKRGLSVNTTFRYPQ